ncbi:MAG: hypothetical protein ACR2PF_04210 [Rhizobiaceae bacterium]
MNVINLTHVDRRAVLATPGAIAVDMCGFFILLIPVFWYGYQDSRLAFLPISN